MRRIGKDNIHSLKFLTFFVVFVLLPACSSVPPSPTPLTPRVDLTVDVEARLHGNIDGVATPVESLPFFLRFNIKLRDSSMGQCGEVTTPAHLTALILKELRYKLIDQNGTPFFSDSVVLYGSHGPGTLIVQPGLTIPEQSDSISIQGELIYDALTFSDNCDVIPVEATVSLREGDTNRVSIDVRAIPVGAQYERISTSYKRRHLLGQGRHLSAIWLKEFDPARDRKELLYHSRTLHFADDARTRVFVPWTFECHKRPPLTLEDGDEEKGCGQSLHSTSVSIYAGEENPLLRGGIAMATFALEARRYLQDTSLEADERINQAIKRIWPALKLLSHVKASEWIDADGQRTGFFLRGDRPGKIDGHTGRKYMFASMDEIAGMTLGLYNLHKTLKLMGDGANAFDVKHLIHRLARRLSENHYFTLPYRRVTEEVTVKIGGEVFWTTQTPRWKRIGLPVERQRGWSGSFVFEWFLSRTFAEITGHRYSSPDKTPVYVVENVDIPLPDAIARYAHVIRDNFDIPSWVPIDQILSMVPDDAVLNFLRSNTVLEDWVPEDLIGTEANLFVKAFKAAPDKTDSASPWLDRLLGHVVQRDFTAAERAVYAIQALGILAYYDATENRTYPLCQHLEAQHFLPPNSCISVVMLGDKVELLRSVSNLLFGAYLFEPLDDSGITEGIKAEPPYWNNPMLMHVFQAANPKANPADPEVSAVRREMARFIKGILVNGGVETQIELDKLIPDEIIPFADIPDIFHEFVGRPDRDPDYYAAALSRMFNLSAEFHNGTDRQDFENGIQWAIQTIEENYSYSAPIAEPTIDDWQQVMEPFQPALFSEGDKVPFGKAFIWERRPRSEIRHMEADKFWGLVVDEIRALYRRGEIDRSSRYVALKEGAGLGFLLPYAMLNKPVLDYFYQYKFLPVCYTNPVVEAKTAVAASNICRFWFKQMTPDIYDQKTCQGGGQPGAQCQTDFDCGSGGSCIGDRNDSFDRATNLTIGTRIRLNIDKSTDTQYWKYAVFKPTHGEIQEVPPEMDYDFFYFDNPARENILVTMKYLYYPGGIINRLYLDGQEGTHDSLSPCTGPEPCLRQVSGVIGGLTHHTFMIMGDIGEYEIAIERIAQ
jgi:hypothetical protein